MTLKPLLFIDQPKLVDPYAPMQAEYHTPTVEDEDNQGQDPIEKNTLDQSKQLKNQITGKQSDVFTDMTIDQKLDYLLTRPPHVPRLYCKLTINQAYYRGHILAREDNQFVFEDRHTRKRHLFNIENVTEIRIIGF